MVTRPHYYLGLKDESGERDAYLRPKVIEYLGIGTSCDSSGDAREYRRKFISKNNLADGTAEKGTTMQKMISIPGLYSHQENLVRKALTEWYTDHPNGKGAKQTPKDVKARVDKQIKFLSKPLKIPSTTPKALLGRKMA